MPNKTISGDATLLKEFTRLVNEWYRKVNAWIWQATGTWEYDDSNYATLPIALCPLVDNQQDYELDTNAQKVDRIEVKDSDGNYQPVYPLDKSMIKGEAMSEYKKTAGLPEEYDLIGRSIILYPKVDASMVTTTSGLKAYVSRDVVEFSSSATTREPGFVNSFHPLLHLGASLDYRDVGQDKNLILTQIRDLRKDLKEFYGARHRDMPVKMNVKIETGI